MLGESKSAILEKVPEPFRADFFSIESGTSHQQLLVLFEKSGFTFPVIAKPDVGERGNGVAKINGLDELFEFLSKTKAKYIVQKYIDFPVELGVFYYRFPNAEKGVVSSIVQKEFLQVIGNGKYTLKELIEHYPRARFVKEYLFKKFHEKLDVIVPQNEKIELEGIGNHVRGTMFLDACHLINPQLTEVFDSISKQIDGFYYGRYDLRCKSIEDLYQGKNIQIVELNGCGAEPAHIYQPGFSFWRGQKVLLQHHKIMFEISLANHKNGIPFASFKAIKQAYRKYKQDIENI